MFQRNGVILSLLGVLLLATGVARLTHEWSAHGLFDEGPSALAHTCHGHNHDRPAPPPEGDPERRAPDHRTDCPECAVLAGGGQGMVDPAAEVAPLGLRNELLVAAASAAAPVRAVWRANGRAPPVA